MGRDGRPVHELESYLGTYAHLTAFHEGDLAFAHTHPNGTAVNDRGGPDLTAHAMLPRVGAWRLLRATAIGAGAAGAAALLGGRLPLAEAAAADETTEQGHVHRRAAVRRRTEAHHRRHGVAQPLHPEQDQHEPVGAPLPGRPTAAGPPAAGYPIPDP